MMICVVNYWGKYLIGKCFLAVTTEGFHNFGRGSMKLNLIVKEE
jgi:hypothetical protein